MNSDGVVDQVDTWRATISAEYRASVSAASMAEAFLARISALDAHYRSFITLTPDVAELDAQRADDARAKGMPLPLDGLPIAIKDCIDLAGVPTTVGSQFFNGEIAANDAECTRRLREAGAVVLGKTNLHEFIFGGTTNNPFHGTCRNPWDLQRIPGGSSGGSGAALAAGLCCGALGSDTGGSVRIPAALNGVSGIRPTYGLVSSHGVFPLSRTFDAVGPMARTVTDVAAMLSVLAGYDERDPRSLRQATSVSAPAAAGNLVGFTIGVPTNLFFENVSAETDAAVREAISLLSDLGATLREVSLPGAELASLRSNPIIWAEAFAVHRTRVEEHPEMFGTDTRTRLGLGQQVTGGDFAEALQGMYEWQRAVDEVFADVDIIATPTTARAAPRIDEVETVGVTADLVRFTHQWSLAYVPSLVVPCGFTIEGLPIGLQLAAARWHDTAALRAGLEFQAVTDWHLRQPEPALVGAD